MIDGIDVLTIQTVLAEVGPDLSAWKTEQHCVLSARLRSTGGDGLVQKQ
jgi:hypothetical protein